MIFVIFKNSFTFATDMSNASHEENLTNPQIGILLVIIFILLGLIALFGASQISLSDQGQFAPAKEKGGEHAMMVSMPTGLV